MSNTELTNWPVCPYCKHEDCDLDCLLSSEANKDNLWKCWYCKKEYKLDITIKYQYTTSKLEENAN